MGRSPGTGEKAAKVSVSRYQDPLISLGALEDDRIWFRLQVTGRRLGRYSRVVQVRRVLFSALATVLATVATERR
jgi:hypothetical protein